MITVFYTEINSFVDKQFLISKINCLAQKQKERILNYKKDKDKLARFCALMLLSKLLVYYNLSSKLDISCLKYTQTNKPYFDADLDFSIAHSGNLVAVAATMIGKIGIDIEKKEEIEIDLMKEYFTEADWNTIKNSKNSNLEFYQLWVRKEAFIKATGLGVLHSLSEIELNKHPIIYNNQNYYLKDIAIKDEYAVCIASNFNPININTINVDLNELLQMY